MVLSRPDAEDEGVAAVLRQARFVYLAGNSPMHVRSVLKGSRVWDALVDAWRGGSVVAGSSAAAMALTDPMVDARGGGLTIGLGLVTGMAVVPHFGDTARTGTGTSSTARCCSPPPARRSSGSPSSPPSSGSTTAAGVQPAGSPSRSSSTAPGWTRASARCRADRSGGHSPRRRGQSDSVMVTDSMTTCSDGVPDRLPVDSIACTTSRPLTTLPKSE